MMDKIKVTIELDLAEMFGPDYQRVMPDGDWEVSGPPTPEAYIARLAAQQLLTDEVRRQFDQRVREIRDEMISESVGQIIRSRLNDTVLTTAGRYGDGPARETTLGALIDEEVKKQLTYSPARDSYSQAKSVLRDVIHNGVETRLKNELQAELEKARQQVRAAAQKIAAEAIGKTVERMNRGDL